MWNRICSGPLRLGGAPWPELSPRALPAAPIFAPKPYPGTPCHNSFRLACMNFRTIPRNLGPILHEKPSNSKEMRFRLNGSEWAQRCALEECV